MSPLILSPLPRASDAFEVVERKGLGHPDTICDALAECFSRRLCREYLDRFGHILHHNVDKALLVGGQAAPAYGGGRLLAPINIHLAGRAVAEVDEMRIPIRDIAVDTARIWLRENIHALDAERDVNLHVVTRPGSQDLQAVFRHGEAREVARANDSSIGVGYAPLSPLERLVLAVERRISENGRRSVPAWGEDVKVLGLRHGEHVRLTIACAMVGRYLAGFDDYLAQKEALAQLARSVAAENGFPQCEVVVNAADDIAGGDVYLTVTGTSAEAGDDGEAGRGNRINGLITPGRPMTLEAAAGKNPRSHTGKIYSVAARGIAEMLVAELPEISEAHCIMVSEIGHPLNKPAAVHVRLATGDATLENLRRRVEDIVDRALARIPFMVEDFVAGKVDVF